MESPIWVPSAPGGFRCICILLLGVQATGAQGVNAAAVVGIAIGVSLVTSLLTTAVTTGIFICIWRYQRRKKHLKRDEVTRASVVCSVRSDESSQPLTRTGQYVRQMSSLSSASSHHNGDLRKSRVKSDFIAKWCTEHTLTEKTADVLRDHGFTYQEAVEAMDVDDIAKLGLQRAQECILRQVVNVRQRPSTGSQSHAYKQSRYGSEEAIPLTVVKDHNTSGGSNSVFDSKFERTQSLDQVDGPTTSPLQGAIITRKSMGSAMDIIETEGTPGEATIVIRSSHTVVHESNPTLIHHALMKDNNNPKRFNGLLSDKGLYDLARMIGVEWTQLGTFLNIPASMQSQIKMNHPSNTLQQIYEMLRMWRDTTEGSKQSVKGRLYDAMCKCGRSDLGEDILREEAHGSKEKVAYHSII